MATPDDSSAGLPSPAPAGAPHGAGRAALADLLVGLFFIVLAVLLTWPLAAAPGRLVPGTGPDDNMVFLWNIWWMRQALSSPADTFLHTAYLFHPVGADLVLHAHTALAAFAGATAFGGFPLPVALNLTLLGSCALNGFTTYLLAHRATAHRLAAVTAGVFFAASPAMTAHLYGHFNMYVAWVLVLFAWMLI
jgi:hypothetical protein